MDNYVKQYKLRGVGFKFGDTWNDDLEILIRLILKNINLQRKKVILIYRVAF